MHKYPEKLNAQLLQQALQRFSSLPEARAMLEKLQNVVPLPLPCNLDPAWHASTMLQWVRNEYMPYLAWVLRTNQPREEQMTLGQAFADWLVKEYPNLLFDGTAPLITNQQQKVGEHLRDASLDVIFWFIVDGLTWWQAMYLLELCRQKRWGVKRFAPIISTLPSITEISKRALIEGCLQREWPTKAFPDLAREKLKAVCASVAVYTGYANFWEALQGPLDKRGYVFFYNELDSANHTSNTWTGDDPLFQSHLERLIVLVETAFERCRQRNLRCTVLVHSDHGCTLLPQGADVIAVSSSNEIGTEDDAEDVSGPDPRHRYCWLTPNGVAATEGCYRLEGGLFMLPCDAFIPQGYAAMGRRPKGWTHGGATPEEVVTAFLEIQPEPVPWIELEVALSGELRPREKSRLTVRITNANATPVESVNLLLDDDTRSTWSTVGAYAYVEAEVDVRPAQGTQDNETLGWQLTYAADGVEHQVDGKSGFHVRRMQSRSEADELLGGL
jgi:hypothetical protein